jgi:hypothetical protein
MTTAQKRQIQQLTEILESTKSVDVFLLTVQLLEKLDAQNEKIVPCILRNAERLKLLDCAVVEKMTREEVAHQIAESVARLAEAQDSTPRKVTRQSLTAVPNVIVPTALEAPAHPPTDDIDFLPPPAESTEPPGVVSSPSPLPNPTKLVAEPLPSSVIEEAKCDEPPDEARVLRALKPLDVSNTPFAVKTTRDNIQVTYELISSKVEEPRFYPNVGIACMHRCHWKCTVFYSETIEAGEPFAYRAVRSKTQLVYIDMDQLRPVASTTQAKSTY